MKILRPVPIAIITIIIYSVFLAFSEFTSALKIIANFPPHLFVLMLILALCNYAIRFVKWHYLCRLVEVRLPLKKSLLIFFSGFSMTISPAKAGELIKPYILKNHGYEISRTTPVVIVERITDLFGMCLLVIIGSLVSGILFGPMLILLLILFSIVMAIQIEGLARTLLGFVKTISYIREYHNSLENLYSSSKLLTSSCPLLLGIAFSVFSWLFECLCLYVALKGIDFDTSISSSLIIFGLSSIAGILAMLPGGLGVTEGMMVILLKSEGVPLAAANAAALLSRFATLWFAVFLGFIALFLYKRYGMR